MGFRVSPLPAATYLWWKSLRYSTKKRLDPFETLSVTMQGRQEGTTTKRISAVFCFQGRGFTASQIYLYLIKRMLGCDESTRDLSAISFAVMLTDAILLLTLSKSNNWLRTKCRIISQCSCFSVYQEKGTFKKTSLGCIPD